MSRPPSVNFHLWRPCNMRCEFCFATFQDIDRTVLPRGHLHHEEAREVARLLGRAFEKINFAGGEPLLCPWLVDLMVTAKEGGAATSIVTNGSLLTPAFLDAAAPALDWIGLSVDSPFAETNRSHGRATRSGPYDAAAYVQIAEAIRARRFRLKINTVVTALNWEEDMSDLIRALAPERWKILQVLPVEGQNDGIVDPLLIDDSHFQSYVERHLHLQHDGIAIVPEENEVLTGSYAMVDPAGRFFDNTKGRHSYSHPILEVGLDVAWDQVCFAADRFEKRGGRYSW